MTITCASGLTTESPVVTVPGDVVLLIDLANTAASGVADLEFVLLDPTLAVCFRDGGRTYRARVQVPNVGLIVRQQLFLACCHGNLGTVDTVLPIGVHVFEKGVLRCAPRTFVTVTSHQCAGILSPLHTDRLSPISEFMLASTPQLKVKPQQSAPASKGGAMKARRKSGKSAKPTMKKTTKGEL